MHISAVKSFHLLQADTPRSLATFTQSYLLPKPTI